MILEDLMLLENLEMVQLKLGVIWKLLVMEQIMQDFLKLLWMIAEMLLFIGDRPQVLLWLIKLKTLLVN